MKKTAIAYVTLRIGLLVPCLVFSEQHVANDLQSVLQTVIDAKELDGYYHADTLPERKPLRLLVDKGIHQELGDLTKFGEPVQFIDQATTNKPYLAFDTIFVTTQRAIVTYRYPPEGIRGKVTLAKNKGGWIIEAFELHEH
jgi:hypothetical protein